jgi:hypothetical protein
LSDDISAAALLPAAAELWSVMNELSGAVTDAYRDTIADRARRDAQTRNAMLDVLLRGDASRLWESAAGLGLPRHGTFVAVAAHPPGPDLEAIPNADDALRARGVERRGGSRSTRTSASSSSLRAPGSTDCAPISLGSPNGPVGVSEPYVSLDRLRPPCARPASPAQPPHPTATT